MTTAAVISIIGSIASIVSFFLAAPNFKSRVIHIIYAVILTVVVGTAVIYAERNQATLAASEEKQKHLEAELAELKSLSGEARKLLQTRGTLISTTDVGENRGFYLAGLGFLERNKHYFPELYHTAKELGVGMRITQPSGRHDYDEEKRMQDGANAMRAMLEGIAVPKE